MNPAIPGAGVAAATFRQRAFDRRALAAIFAAAFGLRLWYAGALFDTPCFTHPMAEAANYLGWAAAIREGRGGLELPFDEGPAYPVLLAAIGGVPTRVVLLQLIVGSATAVGLAIIAARLRRDRLVGFAAGALAAAYGPFILNASEVGPATMFLGALVLSTITTLVATDSGTRRQGWWLAGASLCWALSLAFRSEAVVALPFVAFYVLATTRSRARLAAILGGSVLYMSVMTIATTLESGHPVPLTIGSGIAFWVGNHPSADGISPFPSEAQQAELEDIRKRSGGDLTLEDRRLLSAALAHLQRHPLDGLARLAKKAILTIQARELPNTVATDWQVGRSRLFTAWPVFPFDFGLLVALAALSVRSSEKNASWLLLAGLAAIGLSTPVLFVSCGRFRLPTALPLLILAAQGARRLLRKDVWRPISSGARLLALALATVVVVQVDFLGVSHYFIPELEVNAALCERASGHLSEARRRLERALGVRPDDAGAWMELARVRELQGDHEAATAAYRSGQAASQGRSRPPAM